MKEDNSHPDQIARLEQLNKFRIETVHGVKQDVVFSSYPEGITVEESLSTEDYVKKIVGWHHDRNLIEGSSDKDQFCKLIQEAGELSDNICKGKDVSDDIGDMIVVLLNIAERNKLSLTDCLSKAWDDIKDRKGRMVDGIFVKETDL
tara:strand:+ start:209 stop:649 length:441 start_codon:yes stop_codon:yes gene_type:complete